MKYFFLDNHSLQVPFCHFQTKLIFLVINPSRLKEVESLSIVRQNLIAKTILENSVHFWNTISKALQT